MNFKSALFSALLFSISCTASMAQTAAKPGAKVKAEIAAPYIGNWARDKEGCELIKQGIDAGLFIDKKSIQVGTIESCEIRSVKKADEKTFSALYKCSSEGESMSKTLTMTLKDANSMVYVDMNNEPASFMKCGK